jgi:glucose-1-phosphate cytidylyltransferase
MKAVILAGGLGTRMIEETATKPKPMVKIGEMPIIWHIMKIYAHYGITDFIICCGYKGEVIKEFFKKCSEPWKVIVVDTHLETMTGGRLKKIAKFLDNETFCFTYGDTLNDLNIKNLLKFHKKMKKLATVTACIPPEKYGVLKINSDLVVDFVEKPVKKGEWVNGGFFVLEPEIINYITDDSTIWEKEPLQKLAKENQLAAYKHTGFYQPMDTISDKKNLEKQWKSEKPSWKVW